MSLFFSLIIGLFLLTALPSRSLGAPAGKAGNETKETTLPDTHRVTRGETLWAIAMKHNTSVGEIMDLNHMEDTRVKEGQLLKLKVPVAVAVTSESKKQTHTVREGETLRSIAKEHHITDGEISKANQNVNPKALKIGSKLVIPDAVPETKTTPSREMVSHMVKSGETFYSIAKQYRANLDDVVAANPTVKPERLHEGLIVKVPLNEAPAAINQESVKKSKSASLSPANNESGAKKPVAKPSEIAKSNPTNRPKESPAVNKPSVSPKTDEENKVVKKSGTPAETSKQNTIPEVRSYIVNEGETADSIAAKHRVSTKRLLEYNLLPPNSTLRSGDEIMIPRGSASVVNR